jgi:hypothetical protein
MSTDYRPLNQLRFSDLFDGRLERLGIKEPNETTELYMCDFGRPEPYKTTETLRCLTDGRNYVWVHSDDQGFLSDITTCFPGGAPGKILGAISEEFNTDIVSEHEPQFWGFDTQQEWDAYQEKIAREHEEEFHIELLKHLRGEANDIRPGTVGMLQAQIAEKLVAERPELLLPAHKQELLDAINAIYDRDHSVRGTLTDREIAAAQLAVTHEDDLPKA